jgi:hypothetical protein
VNSEINSFSTLSQDSFLIMLKVSFVFIFDLLRAVFVLFALAGYVHLFILLHSKLSVTCIYCIQITGRHVVMLCLMAEIVKLHAVMILRSHY